MIRFHRTILVGVLALAALMVSCIAEQETTEVDITTVRCKISKIDVEEDFSTGISDTLTATKATFSGANFLWSAGDKIGIVPSNGAQIYFEVDAGAGTSTASFDGGDWAMKSTGTFFAYYPLYPDIFLSKDHVSVSFTGQTQSGNNNNLHAGDYWTLYTEGTSAVGNTLSFSFNHLTAFFKTYVTVPAGTYTKIAFSAPSEVFIKEGYMDLSAQSPIIVGTEYTNEISLDLQNVTFADETELTGYLVVAPVDIAGIPITVTVYKDEEPTYEYTLVKANNMTAAKTYAFRATSITQLAASATEANALFASGATAVSLTEPLTENATIILPSTSEAVTLTLPATASTSTLTVAYPQNAASYPATVSIAGPEGANLDIRTPNSTVTVDGISYDKVTSRTAANTCIIPVGVIVNNLKVVQGGVQVYGTVSQIDLSEREDDAIINVSGTVTSLLGEDDEEYIPATGVTLNKSSINLNVGATESLAAIVAPAGAYPKVTWSSSNKAVATVLADGEVTAIAEGSATITATSISGGFTATCTLTVSNGYQYVDLGLSVLWGTCNLGASSPEEYGNHYAWGEKETKMTYSWGNYLFGTNPFTKYNTNIYEIYEQGNVFDNKRLLNEDDDVAHVLLGGNWRMPTEEEIAELCDLNKCNWQWASENGISGFRITSRIAGHTDQSIFLPAAGYQNGDSISVGENGSYWSLSMGSSQDRAYGIFFRTPSSPAGWGDMERYYGLSIRPVYGPRIHTSSVSLGSPAITIPIGDAQTLTCVISPANAFDKGLLWSSDDSSIVSVTQEGEIVAKSIGTTTITVESTDGSGCSDSCTITVVRDPSNELTAVDLGLSVQWGSCNLGALHPGGYGNYYAWAELRAQPLLEQSYDLGQECEHYLWTNAYANGNGYRIAVTKYCQANKETLWEGEGEVDDKTELKDYDYEDDAAFVQLGGTWHIPTAEDWRELINNCTWTWMTRNGIRGYRVESNINGNSIFLPVIADKVDTPQGDGNYYGMYWSSSLGTIPLDAQRVWINSSGHSLGESFRWERLQVRPVKE